MLFRLKPIRSMNANVPMMLVGTAVAAISVVRQSRMNRKITPATRNAASTRWNFTSSIDPLMNFDWSRITSMLDVGRQRRLDLLQPRLHRVGDRDRVPARLLLHDQADGDVAVEPRLAARLLDAVRNRRHFLQPDRVLAPVFVRPAWQ